MLWVSEKAVYDGSKPVRGGVPICWPWFGPYDPQALGSANQRRIVMEKVNSASAVVWNPGPEGAKGFADMPDDQYTYMVCVEAANALDNAYALKPGESHSMKMTITAE